MVSALPSLQQLKSDGLCPKIDLQFSVPHTRFPLHSLSLLQCPSPTSHIFDFVQQFAPSLSLCLPSHPDVDSMGKQNSKNGGKCHMKCFLLFKIVNSCYVKQKVGQ